jgi:hypothetical protein
MFFGFDTFDSIKMNVLDNDYFKVEAFPVINDVPDTKNPIPLKLCK